MESGWIKLGSDVDIKHNQSITNGKDLRPITYAVKEDDDFTTVQTKRRPSYGKLKSIVE